MSYNFLGDFKMNSEIIEAQNRIKNKRRQYVDQGIVIKESSQYISNLFTRTLLSVILVLICAIFVNLEDENLLFFKDKLFNDTLAFTKINELYVKYFGDIVPDKVNKTTSVFNDASLLTSLEPWNDSYKGIVNSNPVSFLESGIVVFSGNKEGGFGKTVIVQGVDGVDIWYSNLDDVNLTIYDYVEKGNILGNVVDNEIILTFMEDGNYIGYERYISEI